MKIILTINQLFKTNYHNKVQFKNYQIKAIFSFKSLKMDEDECLSIILSMGFPNIEEIKKALRYAKNDVNEAVS